MQPHMALRVSLTGRAYTDATLVFFRCVIEPFLCHAEFSFFYPVAKRTKVSVCVDVQITASNMANIHLKPDEPSIELNFNIELNLALDKTGMKL